MKVTVKKISAGYFIVALPLIVWAVADLYHYFAIGRELVEFYSGTESIRRLAENSLVQAAVKLLLAGGILALGMIAIQKGSKKQPGALNRVTALLWSAGLLMWGACMVCITLTTTQQLFNAMVSAGESFAESVSSIGQFEEDRWVDYDDAYLQYQMRFAADNCTGCSVGDSSWLYEDGDYGSGKGVSLLRDERVSMEVAVIFTDGQGELLCRSGDFLYFGYQNEESWKKNPNGAADGRGWIDLSNREDPRYALFWNMHEKDITSLWPYIREMEFTGYWDGDRFEPVRMRLIGGDMWDYALKRLGPTNSYMDEDGTLVEEYSYTVQDVLEQDGTQWELVFDCLDTVESAGEPVRIYVSHADMSVYEPGDSVRWDQTEYWIRYAQFHGMTSAEAAEGAEYENLMALLEDIRTASAGESWGNVCFWRCGFDELIMLDRYTYRDWSGYDFSANAEIPEARFQMFTAVRGYPLRSAMMLLRNVYIATFLLLAALVMWVRRVIRDELIRPVREANRAIENNEWYMAAYQEDPPAWAESRGLIENVSMTLRSRAQKENEITRLNTALTYAQNAEKKRRQMTSNIAHELKTPLAVVHSYAEGLQEHIAEEKREQYLATILAETERMDGMVLEMLDLSRLEAGKVKLARDAFDLSELAQSVFDTLALKAEERGLRMQLDFPGNIMVSADESRIRQVIGNFASNAVKYTPEGGRVWARVFRERGTTVFSVENECRPFSREELEKVWESFWRRDDSRTGRAGTGLGLTIAKNIVELHGGSVSVSSTENGVEFRFRL